MTALGCFLGVGAAELRGLGSADLAGKPVAVQGLGSVGYGLAERLTPGRKPGFARREPRAPQRGRVAEHGAEVVDSDDVYDASVTLFALRARRDLNDETLARLSCGAIAGAANNQLLERSATAST